MSPVRISTDREGYRVVPFTIGVVAPLSGDKPSRARWLSVDRDTIDELFSRLAPELKLPQGTFLFRSIDDFEPDALARHVRDLPTPVPPAPAPPAPSAPPAAKPAESQGGGLLDSLFASAPPSPARRDDFISNLVDEALQGTEIFRGPEPVKSFNAADAVRAVLREPAFRRLETAWRGLYHLVRHADTGPTLKLKVFDGRREELPIALERLREPSEEPMGMIVADFAFGPGDEDVTLLYPLLKILAAAHCVLVAGWADGPDGQAWEVFRRLDSARHLVLAGPRVLARRPYTEANDAPFAEVRRPEDASDYTWMNAAFHVGTLVATGVGHTGWFADLHGVRLNDLPTFTYKDEDGEMTLRCPLEIALDERREREMAGRGVLTLVHVRGTDQAHLAVSRTVQNPTEHADPDLEQAAAVMSRLPFVLATGRFVHAVRVGGTTMEEMNGWLSDYVGPRGPLLDAQVERRGGRLELYLQPWLGREELPGAVAVEA